MNTAKYHEVTIASWRELWIHPYQSHALQLRATSGKRHMYYILNFSPESGSQAEADVVVQLRGQEPTKMLQVRSCDYTVFMHSLVLPLFVATETSAFLFLLCTLCAQRFRNVKYTWVLPIYRVHKHYRCIKYGPLCFLKVMQFQSDNFTLPNFLF